MIETVTEGKSLISPGREGARTVAVCRAVVESAATGKTVEINILFKNLAKHCQTKA